METECRVLAWCPEAAFGGEGLVCSAGNVEGVGFARVGWLVFLSIMRGKKWAEWIKCKECVLAAQARTGRLSLLGGVLFSGNQTNQIVTFLTQFLHSVAFTKIS